MEKSGKRGKIPQSDWPLIMARYEQGETLTSIARTYDCSPPAISYIVSRSREKPATETVAAAPAETQLVKSAASSASGNGSAEIEPTEATAPETSTVLHSEPSAGLHLATSSNGAAANGTATNGAAANGEPRRTLHLSLGGHGNGAQASVNGDAHNQERPVAAAPREQQAAGVGNGQRPFQASPPASLNPPPFDAGRFALPEGKSAQQPRDEDAPRKDNGAFIDQELRSRVDGDIAAFLAAFDAALAADTQESRFGLREATDRLLRAGARTRIELERLEARVPLTPREGGVAEPAGWRYR